MKATYRDQLYQAAARVLRRCANGRFPVTADVRFLRNALPLQTGMRPAELAGLIIWRIQAAAGDLDRAA